MTDLERFFRRIVSNLAATDPRRLGEPIPLADIPLSIVPYRTNRRALRLDSSEEYEMVLLRLCAGEGGYIRTDPEQVRQKFEAETRSANPDLEVIHRFEDVSIVLRADRVDRAMQPAEEFDVMPAAGPPLAPRFDEPEEIGEHEIEEAVADEELGEEELPPADESSGSQCVYCGGGLPGRPVNFCPHCGQSQVATVCPRCHADVEPGWRHCVNCGAALGGR